MFVVPQIFSNSDEKAFLSDFEDSKNLQLLDILACNSANKQPISWITDQNVQKLLILAVFT